ncbi:hypothetical protein PFISCL1PPCAC_5749, partial [Pristionchus fissidentatus]
FNCRMSFMKSLFGKGKKKEEKEEQKKDPFKRDQSQRRSVHLGDRSFGAENLPSYYQSVGHKYPKGPKSCPGVESREGDEDSLGARTDFEYSHKRKSKRGILVNRRDIDRHSDYSSQDPSPLSSHFSRPNQAPPSRHYHSSLDESDEENDYNGRIREKLRRTEEEKMAIESRYQELKWRVKSDREEERRRVKIEREEERRRNSDTVDSFRRQLKEMERKYDKVREQNEQLRRELHRREKYEPSMDSQNLKWMQELQELRQLKSHYESSLRPSSFLAPFTPFPPMPYTNTFSSTYPTASTATGTPSTSIVEEPAQDGAGEALWDPEDTSFRPFNASLSEQMNGSSAPFPFSTPLTMPERETPRSEETIAETSDLSFRNNMDSLQESSFRPPLPSTMPPRRISQSDPAISSPPRKI